jgi:hypothetical protein
MEQQKNAFYDLGIELQSLEDFMQMLAPFKSKTTSQFPPPEQLYKKKFSFLPAPIIVLQKTQKMGDSATKSPVKKDSPSRITSFNLLDRGIS